MFPSNGSWSTALAMAMAVAVLLSERGKGALGLATDIFKSPCPPIVNPDYRLWSSPATWPNSVVPGVSKGVNLDAVIPCGVAVLLDLPNITVGVLKIQGLLSFQDDTDLPQIYVKARHVLVEGKLSIGSFKKQFSQKATFELTPSPNRDQLKFTSFPPANSSNPHFIGHKAFAVVGGQVDLHGMPGGSNTPSWCQLAATAEAGSKSIVVDNPLALQWPVGGVIVLATTDYDYSQSEQRIIQKVSKSAGKVVVTLNQPLAYSHNGVNVSDGMGGWVDQRAEVALLSRNIVITGTDEPSPYNLLGGHFIIYQTPDPPQYIEGVEFYKMGQQGCLGRYSLHFHVVGSSPSSIAVRNSIHQSKQRCLVVHASHSITLRENVAFNTTGHCFSLEEGGEQNNVFDSNLAITARRALKLIPGETDNNPAQYWMQAPGNIHINNRAVGSLDSGFWWDTGKTVRGMSLSIPALKNISPDNTIVKKFKGNVAHSCHNVGMKTYPSGFKPLQGTNGSIGSVFEDLLIYKHSTRGMFLHLSQFLTVTGTFADNGVGILILESRAIHVTRSKFVGLTTNYGNPTGCHTPDPRGWYSKCMPISGCAMPLSANVSGRTHSGFMTDPYYGVQISHERRITGHTFPNRVSYTRFANFNSSCSKPAKPAAIIPVRTAVLGSSFNPQFSLKGLQFFTDSLPTYFFPRMAKYEQMNLTTDTGEVSQYIVMKDLDGSIIGKPGAIVANNRGLIASSNCTFFPNMNAYGCYGACYRSIRMEYPEPGFEKSKKSTNQRGDFSALKITRVSDGKAVVIDGNLNDPASTASFPTRVYFLILLAGETYDIVVVPPNGNSSFYPTKIKMGYHDDKASCKASIRLRFKPPPIATYQWFINKTLSKVMPRTCNGANMEPSATAVAQYVYTCVSRVSFLDLELPAYFINTFTIQALVGSQSCMRTQPCNILSNLQNGWLWDASGAERRPAFYETNANTSTFNKSGAAVFGFNNVKSGLKTFLPKPSQALITYYFRKTFPLKDTRCFSSLFVQLFVEDGIVLYLNGKELLRSNMPTGAVNKSTLALVKKYAWMAWQNFTVPLPDPKSTYGLVDGNNTVAAEIHVYNRGAKRVLFDMQIVGNQKIDCTGGTPQV